MDCSYVADGAAGDGDVFQFLVASADGDLWRELPGELPAAMWVPAHLSVGEAAGRGVPRLHWGGNRDADVAANAAAERRRLPAHTRRGTCRRRREARGCR